MLKKFISDVAVVQFLNLLVKPFWIFAIDRTVQNVLPTQEYGAYFTLLGFSLLFVVFLDLGVSGFNTTSGAENTLRLTKRFSQMASIKIVLATFYLLMVLLAGFLLGYTTNHFLLLLGVATIQIFTSFNGFLRGIVGALHLFKFEGLFMVLERVIAIIICGILIWGDIDGLNLTILSFTYTQLFATAVVCVLLFGFVLRKLKDIRFSFTTDSFRHILRRSWPFALLTALMGFYHYLDAVMLEQLGANGTLDAGVYAMGFRIFFVMLMFTHVFSNILLPMFSRNKKKVENLKLLSVFGSKILIWIAVGVAIVSWSYQVEIIYMLYPQKYSDEAARAFAWLMMGYIGTVLVVIYGTLLTALQKLKHLNALLLLTIFINIVLNYLLIPTLGVEGAAIATFISQWILGLGSLIITYKVFTWSYNVRLFFGALSYFGITFFAISLAQTITDNPFFLVPSALVAGILGFLLLGLHKFQKVAVVSG